jgi:hypothetical protein
VSLIACYSNEFILYTSVGRVFTLLKTASSGFKNISESSLTISVSRGGETQKTINFDSFLSFLTLAVSISLLLPVQLL